MRWYPRVSGRAFAALHTCYMYTNTDRGHSLQLGLVGNFHSQFSDSLVLRKLNALHRPTLREYTLAYTTTMSQHETRRE